MSIPTLIKQLRALPYADMVMVAKEIDKQLLQHSCGGVAGRQEAIATILSSLQPSQIPVSDETQQEGKILREIFRTKRTATIQKHNGGWQLEIPTIAASTTHGTELRGMFPQMLDQIITMHVLSRK